MFAYNTVMLGGNKVKVNSELTVYYNLATNVISWPFLAE